MKSPVLYLACAFALGILLAEPGRGSPIMLIPGCAVCLAAAWLSNRRNRALAAGAFVLAGFAFAGAASLQLFEQRFPADHISRLDAWGMNLDRPLLVQGIVATVPLQMPYGLQFDLSVSRISDGKQSRATSGKIRLRVLSGEKSTLPASALHLQYGDTILASARLGRPEDDRNPGGFDYRRWMESIHDIYWQGVADGVDSVRKIPGRGAPIVGRVVESVRTRLINGIDRMYPPWSVDGRDGAVLKAILLGDRSALDSSTVEDFRKSGLYHLLVVAGLHVGLLVLLAEGLLRLLGVRETWRVPLLLAFLCVYAALVEQRAPTLRASLMIGAYLMARALDRDQPAMNAIGIAALILLFHRPAWLLDAGFQLSFAAALLIAGLAVPVLERLTEPYRRGLRQLDDSGYDIAFEPRVAQFRLDTRGFAALLGSKSSILGDRLALKTVSGFLRLATWTAELIIFSAVLQLGLLLPMAEIFHRVTLAGIGLNALAVPLMTVLLAIAAPVTLLAAFSAALAEYPATLLALVMKGLFTLTELRRMPHWLSFRVPPPPLWVALGFALAVIIAAGGLHSRRSILVPGSVVALAFATLIALYPFRPRIPTGAFQVTQLDCGGGEALFVVLPERTTVLAGACGRSGGGFGGGNPVGSRRWDPGENVVSPYLWSRGIKSIDVFLAPDATGDRLNGMSSVLRNFRVRQFWHGDLPPGADARTIMGLVDSLGTAMRRLAPGETLAVGESTLTVLWASAGGSDVGGRRRGAPLLVRISDASGSLLLAAGLNRADQTQVLRTSVSLTSTVLAGSDLRPALIARVNPAVVLETTARRNEADEIARPRGRLDPRRTTVFNVNRVGAVTVSIQAGVVRAWRDMRN